jgi:membrane protease YdiL (CAAX protease family)
MKELSMKKASALVMGLAFPISYWLLQLSVSVAVYWGVYIFKKAADPQVSSDMLQNRAEAAVAGVTSWRVILSGVLFLLLAALFFRFQKTTLRQTSRMLPINIKTALPYLLAAGLGMNIALGGAFKWLPIPSEWMAENAQAVNSLSAAGLPAQILCVVIMAPVVEEVIYRGLCLSYLQKGFSLPMAVVWQALLFGAFHGTKLQFIYAFLAGLVLGAVCLLCGSVWGSIFVHMAFNGVSILLEMLPISTSQGFWAGMGMAGIILLCFSMTGLQLRFKKPDCAMDT